MSADMTGRCFITLVLAVLLGVNHQVAAEDIFLTVADGTQSIDDIMAGVMPSDTGGEMITIGPQDTAAIMLWSDGELLMDPSTGSAFGYSITSTNSNDSVITEISGVTSINPMGSDGNLRWFDIFDFDITWTAIGAATFDSGQGVGPNRKSMDPFYDPDRNAFLLGYGTLTAGDFGVSEILPSIVPILSLNGSETVGGVTVTVASIPEPGTTVIGMLVIAGLVVRRNRK